MPDEDEYVTFYEAPPRNSWDNPPNSNPFEEMLAAFHLQMDGAILFGFARTPDGRPFLAYPREDGVYVITDAQEPEHAQDSHRGDQELRKPLPGVQGDLDL